MGVAYDTFIQPVSIEIKMYKCTEICFLNHNKTGFMSLYQNLV